MGVNMFKKLSFLIAICLIFPLSSCNYSILEKNNRNLTKLKVGMSKEEVLSIMGDPLVNEVYNTDNVWYYFTEVKWSDGMITRDEATPVFFKDEKLAGWGQQEYKQFRQVKW